MFGASWKPSDACPLDTMGIYNLSQFAQSGIAGYILKPDGLQTGRPAPAAFGGSAENFSFPRYLGIYFKSNE